MPSFDVVSKINQPEVDNALLQSQKEIGTRYDFKDTGTTIERTTEGIVILSNSEGKVEATYEVLITKMIKRGVSLKQLDPRTLKALSIILSDRKRGEDLLQSLSVINFAVLDEMKRLDKKELSLLLALAAEA